MQIYEILGKNWRILQFFDVRIDIFLYLECFLEDYL